jgi:SpoVK/Ycf46/Vps4 family AAA+-type ATPase
LFFDEIDALASNRSDGDEDSTNVHSRILSTFLNEMDGVSSSTSTNAPSILVVAATNRLSSLDTALLRPGRLEEHVLLSLPTAGDIVDMLHLYLARIRHDLNLDDVATRLVGLEASGADVEGLCQDACLNALKRTDQSEHISLTLNDMEEAILTWKPV